jgi:ATP-binding cassette subfamily F protein uup
MAARRYSTGSTSSCSAGDRLALVGRNGSGKSTLMKVMAGLVEADAGARVLPDGTSVGYLEQDPGFQRGSPRSAISRPRGSAPPRPGAWRRRPRGSTSTSHRAGPTASGGERRRAALARLLAEAPDLMLLDEPTNHLDIAAIAWLEAELSRTRAAFITISHDRAFLRRLARATLWLDRGVVRRMDRPFDGSRTGATRIWAQEDLARHKLDRKIKGRGALGRRGHLCPAQAQPGPGAGACEAARDPRGDDRARGRRGAVAGRRGQGRQAGDRGQGHFPQLRRADGHRAPGPARVARRPGGHRRAERGGQDHASQHADR